jgi:GDP-L-fucose synthase
MWVLENYNEKDTIILSTDDEVSINYISKIIAKLFNYENRLVFDSSKSDGQYKKTADNSKLKKLLPNFEFTSIQNGIENTIDWFKQNYDICRR